MQRICFIAFCIFAYGSPVWTFQCEDLFENPRARVIYLDQFLQSRRSEQVKFKDPATSAADDLIRSLLLQLKIDYDWVAETPSGKNSIVIFDHPTEFGMNTPDIPEIESDPEWFFFIHKAGYNGDLPSYTSAIKTQTDGVLYSQTVANGFGFDIFLKDVSPNKKRIVFSMFWKGMLLSKMPVLLSPRDMNEVKKKTLEANQKLLEILLDIKRNFVSVSPDGALLLTADQGYDRVGLRFKDKQGELVWSAGGSLTLFQPERSAEYSIAGGDFHYVADIRSHNIFAELRIEKTQDPKVRKIILTSHVYGEPQPRIEITLKRKSLLRRFGF